MLFTSPCGTQDDIEPTSMSAPASSSSVAHPPAAPLFSLSTRSCQDNGRFSHSTNTFSRHADGMSTTRCRPAATGRIELILERKRAFPSLRSRLNSQFMRLSAGLRSIFGPQLLPEFSQGLAVLGLSFDLRLLGPNFAYLVIGCL